MDTTAFRKKGSLSLLTCSFILHLDSQAGLNLDWAGTGENRDKPPNIGENNSSNTVIPMRGEATLC